jgi:hypothetical protein
MVAAGQSCSWLLSINLTVLYRSRCAAGGQSYLANLAAGQSCYWLLDNLMANLAADIDLLYLWSILLVSLVRQNGMDTDAGIIALLLLLVVVVVAPNHCWCLC